MVPGATDAALSPDESLYKSTICRNSLQTVGNFTLMLISATVIQSIRTISNHCCRGIYEYMIWTWHYRFLKFNYLSKSLGGVGHLYNFSQICDTAPTR